jgi:hypothetical protein
MNLDGGLGTSSRALDYVARSVRREKLWQRSMLNFEVLLSR